nr:glycine-rich protein DOT1-like [Aegilops tauschii subsp. strangulata]
MELARVEDGEGTTTGFGGRGGEAPGSGAEAAPAVSYGGGEAAATWRRRGGAVDGVRRQGRPARARRRGRGGGRRRGRAAGAGAGSGPGGPGGLPVGSGPAAAEGGGAHVAAAERVRAAAQEHPASGGHVRRGGRGLGFWTAGGFQERH